MPRVFVGLAVALVCASGCGEEIRPIGPTPVGEGIVIYMHADFSGPSQALNLDVVDLGKVEGSCSSGGEGEVPTWADCVSSVRVMPGWVAVLYHKAKFQGESVKLTSDTANLRDLRGPCQDTFNDCAVSIRVARRNE
jgi:Peptidase inhibitor family I36